MQRNTTTQLSINTRRDWAISFQERSGLEEFWRAESSGLLILKSLRDFFFCSSLIISSRVNPASDSLKST